MEGVQLLDDLLCMQANIRFTARHDLQSSPIRFGNFITSWLAANNVITLLKNLPLPMMIKLSVCSIRRKSYQYL